MKIAIFYHIGQIGMWDWVYQSQIHRLYASDLINQSNYIHFGVNGDQELFNVPEKAIVKRNENWKEETDTLISLKDFAHDNPDYKILYFHTKGVSRNTIQANSWRLFMEYFVIDRWRECVEYLNEYDCCGTDYVQSGKNGLCVRRSEWVPLSRILSSNDVAKYPSKYTSFFAGNFWWANTSYINQLSEKYLTSYYRVDRELWIGSNKNCKAKCLFYSDMVEIKDKFYTDIYEEKHYIN